MDLRIAFGKLDLTKDFKTAELLDTAPCFATSTDDRINYGIIHRNLPEGNASAFLSIGIGS